MAATKEQQRKVEKLLSKNEGMIWDGKYGYYSGGAVVIAVCWDFDKQREQFKVKID